MQVSKYKYFFVYAICCVLIFTFNIQNIKLLTMPSILFDEFGYLASGAYWARRDWTNIISNAVSYYSYGYGIIFAVILKCGVNISLAYQLMILLNIIFTCVSLFLSDYVCESFIKDRFLRLLICFSVCFYPSIIHNTQFAWTEIFLGFLYWVLLFLLKKLIKGRKISSAVMSAFVGCYMYSVHQRSLGIVVALIFIMFFLCFFKIISKKHLFVFIVCCTLFLYLNSTVKEYIKENLWNAENQSVSLSSQESQNTTNSIVDINDFGGQTKKILYILTPEGFKCFIMGFFGKIFYFGLATFFFGFEGFYYIAKRGFSLIQNKMYSTLNIELIGFLLFAFMSILSTFLIAAFFLIYPTRIDTVMYGRYTDCFIALVTILGIYNVSKYGLSFKRIFIYVFASLIFLLYFNLFIQQYDLWLNYATCSPISFFYRQILNKCEVEIWVNSMFLITFFLSIIIWTIISFKINFVKYTGIISIVFLWIGITNPAIKYDINMGNKVMVEHIVDTIESVNNDTFIYYVKEGEIPLYVANIQYLLDTKKINIISSDQVNEIEHGIFIFSNSSKCEELLKTSYSLIESNQLCDVWYN